MYKQTKRKHVCVVVIRIIVRLKICKSEATIVQCAIDGTNFEKSKYSKCKLKQFVNCRTKWSRACRRHHSHKDIDASGILTLPPILRDERWHDYDYHPKSFFRR